MTFATNCDGNNSDNKQGCNSNARNNDTAEERSICIQEEETEGRKGISCIDLWSSNQVLASESEAPETTVMLLLFMLLEFASALDVASASAVLLRPKMLVPPVASGKAGLEPDKVLETEVKDDRLPVLVAGAASSCFVVSAVVWRWPS